MVILQNNWPVFFKVLWSWKSRKNVPKWRTWRNTVTKRNVWSWIRSFCYWRHYRTIGKNLKGVKGLAGSNVLRFISWFYQIVLWSYRRVFLFIGNTHSNVRDIRTSGLQLTLERFGVGGGDILCSAIATLDNSAIVSKLKMYINYKDLGQKKRGGSPFFVCIHCCF